MITLEKYSNFFSLREKLNQIIEEVNEALGVNIKKLSSFSPFYVFSKVNEIIETLNNNGSSIKTLTYFTPFFVYEKLNEIIRTVNNGLSTSIWDYYISNAGTSENTGSSPADPVTWEKFLTLNIDDDYSIKFNKGETFEIGDYTISNNNITITSYGTGATPILTGSENVGALTWTSEGSGIYSTTLTDTPKWLFVSGISAKYGETDWLPITAKGTNTITVNSLTGLSNVPGSKLRAKEWNFRMSYEYTVLSVSTNTITLDRNIDSGMSVNAPIKLMGQLQYVTENGEWFFDDATDKLYYKAVSTPAGSDIRICTKNNAFTITGDGVTIDGIEFKHYYSETIDNKGDNFTLENYSIHDIRGNGLRLRGNGTTASTNITITGGSFYRCGLNALAVEAVNGMTFNFNSVHDIGMETNYGYPIYAGKVKSGGDGISSDWDMSIADTTGQDWIIEDNHFYNLGYIGVHMLGDFHEVRRNIIHNFCLRWNDGGGIQSFHRLPANGNSGGLSAKDYIIENNIVYDAIGSTDGFAGSNDIHAIGIYVDNGSDNFLIQNNTVFDCSYVGIMSNWNTRKTQIINNKVVNCDRALIKFRQDTGAAASPDFPNNNGNILTGNQLVCKSISQVCVEVESWNSVTTFNPFSSSGDSNNNIYVQPYSTTICHYRATADGTPTNYTLATWRTKMGLDSTSSERTNYITYSNTTNANVEVQIEANEGTSNEVISIDSGFININGTTITGATIVPYDSVIYLKETAAGALVKVLEDNFTGTNGTAIVNGRTPETGPNAVVAGTHSIQTNRMATTVGGRISWDLSSPNIRFQLLNRVTSVGDGMTTYLRVENSTSTTTRLVLTITNAGGITLAEQIGGVTTNTWNTTQTVATSTDYVISCECSGASVKISVNGVLKIDVTTTLLTGNYFGVFGNTSKLTDYVVAYQM
jgi:hypothetical protein